MILLVERVGRLKPGTRIAEVQVDSIGLRELVVYPVEGVLCVAFGVHYAEFWRIQESASIQTIYRDEISPLLVTVSQAKGSRRGAEEAKGAENAPAGRGAPTRGAWG